MGLTDLLNEHSDKLEGEDLVLAVLEDLLQDDDLLRQVIVPMLRHEITKYMRVRALQTEKDSIVGKPPANPYAKRCS